MGAVSLAAPVRHLCLCAELNKALIDVTGLWGAVEGDVIGALESPRASISTLARHFGLDAIETGGVIRFIMRGGASVATLAMSDTTTHLGLPYLLPPKRRSMSHTTWRCAC